MPHQLVLCKDKPEDFWGKYDATNCQKDYMLVSIFDPIYLAYHEQMLMNDIGYSNIHGYIQGKYVQSLMTMDKIQTTT